MSISYFKFLMVTKLFHVELFIDMQNVVNQCNRTRKITFFAQTEQNLIFFITYAASTSWIGFVIQYFKKLLKLASLSETE